MMEKGRNDAFTAIRLFWAITVVIFHVGVIYQEYFDKDRFCYLFHGNFAVVNFFILSGFLIALHHEDEFFETKKPLKLGFSYAIKSLKKNYLVYVVSFLPWMFVDLFKLIRNFSMASLVNFIWKGGLNVFLLQPVYLFREDLYWNNTSWFFCVLIMIYAISPFLVKICKRFQWIIFLLSICAIVYIGDVREILYYSIVYRVFFFALGICLCFITKDAKTKFNDCKKYKAISYVVLVIHVASWLSDKVWVYTVSSCLFVAFFYIYNDMKLFSKKCFLQGGKISNYIYLLHNVVLSFFGHFVFRILPPDNQIRLWINFILVGGASNIVPWLFYIVEQKIKYKTNKTKKYD